MRDLEKLNPVFARLWNDPAADSGASESSRNDTFRVVSRSVFLEAGLHTDAWLDLYFGRRS